VITATSQLLQRHSLSLVHWLVTAEFWFILATFALLTGILWTRWPLSLAQLRRIETVMVVALLAHLALLLWLDLRFGNALVGALDEPHRDIAYWALGFVILIVGYGTLIPNTARRCILVVGIMGLTPVTILAITGLSAGASLSQLGFLLTYLGMFMGIAVFTATYGSHRIEVLRQEAAEARKLGQYQLKERLGSGGMGEVYLAEHLLLRRPCAVKVIRPERAGDPKELARFEREVQATATLTHPNTVQIFDYGHAEDGTFYYAMEYLPGLSLSELVHRHGPLPPERAIHFLRQVCGALSEAHAIGLIHRDIKPGNIMVCDRGGLHDVAKLLDFGLVRAPARSAGEETLTKEGTIAGTPTYMSPEQGSSRGDLDPRSDIYSLGAVAYFLLTGQPPFSGRSAVEVVAAHLYEPPQPIARHRFDVPGELDAVVLKCLAKDPDHRFSDSASLDQALAGCPVAEAWTQERAAAWWQSHEGANFN
jgi:serine/threonine-protein kinase